MKLTAENYHSLEANRAYMSVSQFKDFEKCEAMAVAKIRGEFTEEPTEAMLVSAFVDAYFSNELDRFMLEHPQIFNSRGGGLKAKFNHAYTIISRIEQDAYMMELFSGETQVIKTGEIAGVPFKIKMDFWQTHKRITDMKIVANFAPIYVPGKGRLSFIEAYGYDKQGGVYQEIDTQNTGEKLPFIIGAATKEASPDIAPIEVPQMLMDYELENVKKMAPYYQALKNGVFEPKRCEVCDYCKATKKVTEMMSLEAFNLRYIEGDA